MWGEEEAESPRDEVMLLRFEEVETQEEKPRFSSTEIDSLRVIRTVINDDVSIEGILDGGSEIVAMDRSVWNKIGVSLDPSKRINMQATNLSMNLTKEVVENLKVSVPGMDLYMQVHILENTPFDFLLR